MPNPPVVKLRTPAIRVQDLEAPSGNSAAMVVLATPSTKPKAPQALTARALQVRDTISETLGGVWNSTRNWVTEILSGDFALAVSPFGRRTSPYSTTSMTPTMSWRRSNYIFWRQAYYGHATGLEISGMLIKPLVSKVAAWTLGRAPQWRIEKGVRTQKALEDWWNVWHSEIMRAWRAAVKQGDSFLVVNSDLTITILPPECVDPIVDPLNYANIIGWRVTQVLPHPTTQQKMRVIDEYYMDRRVHWLEVDYRVMDQQVFPNLLGRLPIIHIANQPDDGEKFGHAEAEGLLSALQRYGIVFEAAVEGNVLQGRPTPVITFKTLKDLDAFWRQYGTRVATPRADGTTDTTMYLDVDLSQIVTLTNGEFEYKSPGSFTADTANLLELLFYLILEHSELPEFIFGNAISSSKASAETQMPVFIEFIQMRRGEMVSWLTEIAEVALGYLSFVKPGVSANAKPTIQWDPLDQDDGQLVLDTVIWAYSQNLIDMATALMLIPVQISDIEDVLRKAKAEQLVKQQMALDLQQQQREAMGTPDPTAAPNGGRPPTNGNGTGPGIARTLPTPPRNGATSGGSNGNRPRATVTEQAEPDRELVPEISDTILYTNGHH